MSTFWRQGAGQEWQPLPIAGDFSRQDQLPGGIRLVRTGPASEGGMGLLARAELFVRVNGHPVLGGFCVLEHKDEILVGQVRFYFSAEATPIRELFQLPAGARAPTCPVCRGKIENDMQAVRCPGCSRWYHQIDAGNGKKAKYCWTYRDTCGLCKHPTSLSGEGVWRPEMEEAHE